MRTRPTPAPSSPPPPSPGARPRATTTSAATTSSGRATWCRPRPPCSPAAAPKPLAARSSTSPARSSPTAASRRTSGSTARPTGPASSSTRSPSPSSSPGASGRPTASASFDIFPFVERAAGFLVRHAPVTQQERWEENAGYSPSTLAAVISASSAPRRCARPRLPTRSACFLEDYADWIEGHLEDWTVTNDGVLASRRPAPLHAHPPARVRRSLRRTKACRH